MNAPNPAPTPCSTGKQCFNCGKDLEKSATFCPHCSAPLPTQGSIVSEFSGAFRIIGAIALSILAFTFVAAGVILVIGTALYIRQFNPYGLLFIGAAALCFWGADILLKMR